MTLDSVTRFDAKALAFRREFGFLPPGKDSPAASGADISEAERSETWQDWLFIYGKVIDCVFDALEELEAE